ncbi:hypothetical protein PHSC3_000798 [Chlamydiales bacterium STE3]|nr:hypothetical protein PHSC3_000798 [Chlamydiales bacterium STE3]
MVFGVLTAVNTLFSDLFIRCNFCLIVFILAAGLSFFSVNADLYQGIHAVIFDCDGVLVDTEYLKFLAWQEVLASKNIDFTIEDYKPLIGHSSENILKMIEKAKAVKLPCQIIEWKNSKYRLLQGQGVVAIQPMVDFVRCLSKEKNKLGISLALASSAPREEILINLRHIGLEEAFDLIISGTEDLENYVDVEGINKPKPYIYIEASKRLNVSPKCCLVFEDTKAGVDAAADAGMQVIAIPNPFTTNQDFSKASKILFSHKELPSIEVFQH